MDIREFLQMVAVGNTEFDVIEREAKHILGRIDRTRKRFKRPSHFYPRSPIHPTLPPDPESTNNKRAQWAADALACFANDTAEPPQPKMTTAERRSIMEQNISDLVGDFGHYCDRAGIDLQECLTIGARRYNEETSNQGEQFTDFAQDGPAAPARALDSRETAMLLHALRTVQCQGRIEGCAAGMCEHFADVDEMTNAEIDDLCERVNFADVKVKPGDEYQTSEQAKAYRNAAMRQADSDVNVDQDAIVSVCDPGRAGAWVAAWVWVTDTDAGVCRMCGAVNADNGEGFDGLCGECADKTQCAHEDGCDTTVEPDSRYFATPCGTFCDEHMKEHAKDCEVCRKAFPELAS